MTPEILRSRKVSMVTSVPLDELLDHPIVEDAPNGGLIAIMAFNTLLETLAQELEQEENEQ